MKQIVFFLFVCSVVFFPQTHKAQNIIYVNQNATGANNGTSWADAYTNLYTAISAAGAYKEVWVAMGDYYAPSSGGFHMKNNVGIYGGFTGTESTRNERDWTINVTTLHGNGNGRVVGNVSNNLDWSAILDGFTIRDGVVKQYGDYYSYGGAGILNYQASPTLRNLIITNNSTDSEQYYFGGGICNYASKCRMINLEITNNSAGKGGGIYNRSGIFNSGSDVEYPEMLNLRIDSNSAVLGGGIYLENCQPTIESSRITRNFSSSDGGGLYAYNSNGFDSVAILNTLFADNISDNGGGAIYADKVDLSIINATIVRNKASNQSSGVFIKYGNCWVYNSIIYHNARPFGSPAIYNPNLIVSTNAYCNLAHNILITSEFCINCITQNPNLVDTLNGDYRPQASSPAINTGNNGYYTASSSTDLAGNPRVYNNTIDMGAFEYQGSPAGIKQNNPDSKALRVFPNPATDVVHVEAVDGTRPDRIRVSDLLGKDVLTPNDLSTIDVSDLPNGIYLLEVMFKNDIRTVKLRVSGH